MASWGPAGRLQPREAGERPPGLGRVAASVPPLGVAGEETSLPAEPRAPGFAWDERGEGGGWMVVGSWVVPCRFGVLLFPNASLLPGVAEWEGK